MNELQEKVQNMLLKVEQNNRWRQTECINLIPSESTPSALVKMCEISDPAGRYAEHRKMQGKEVYFYQGTGFIRDVEEEARKELRAYFNCTDVELRPISGQMANEVVFKGIVKFINRGKAAGQPGRRIRTVVNNDLTKGGHLSSQPMGALFNYVEEDPATGKEAVFHFPVLKDNPYQTDETKLGELMEKARPELIVFGKSMVLYREPVKQVLDIVKDFKPRPVLMYDMAHTLGLYGAFQSPFEEGADLVTGSTHKTFFGPQRGVIAGNLDNASGLDKLWIEIKNRAFPGSTSNHHLGTLLALLMSSYEMNAFKKELQGQVIKNARAFARALYERGIRVEGNPADGFTETHQVLIRVRAYGTGEDMANRLEKNNIITNYQALPDDDSFIGSSGIRMGVQEMTRFGMKEADFAELAEYMSACIKNNTPVADKVKKLRARFLTMQYCLPMDQAASLTAHVFSSIFADSHLVRRFSEELCNTLKL